MEVYVSSQGVKDSAELCSLGTVTGPEGTAWSCIRGESSWVLGKGYSLKAGEVGTAPNLLELGQHSQIKGLNFG